MNRKYKLLTGIYNIIYISGIVFAIHLLIESYTGVTYTYPIVFILTVTLTGIFEYLQYTDKKVRYAVAAVIVIAAVIVTCIIFYAVYMQGKYMTVPGYRDYDAINLMVDIRNELLTALSVAGVCILYRFLHMLRYVRGIIPFILMALIVLSRILDISVTLEATVIVLYIFIINAGSFGMNRHYIYLTPVIMVFCAVLYLIPTGEKPLSWDGVTSILSSVGERINDTYYDIREYLGFDDDSTDATQTGYSELDQVGFVNHIEGDDTVQLRLDGTFHKANLYIAGAYYNHYDGKKWSKKYSDPEYPEQEVALFEKLNTIYNLVKNENKFANYIWIDNLRVTYRGNKKRTLFTTDNMLYNDAEWNYSYKNGSIVFDEERENEDYYNLWYIDMDSMIDTEKLYNYSRFSPDLIDVGNVVNYVDYAFDYDIMKYIGGERISDIYSLLDARKHYVSMNYGEEFENIPDRIYTLATLITANERNDYAKAKAIEEYLAENYDYSLDIDTDDGEVKGIDEFLFEGKKGSCLHFSTAFAVLARCVGIPSRIATGYCVKTGRNEADGRQYVLAKGSDGHAWPELYFNNVGWCRFEPTTSYYTGAYVEDDPDTMPSDTGSRKKGGGRISGKKSGDDDAKDSNKRNASDKGKNKTPVPSAAPTSDAADNHSRGEGFFAVTGGKILVIAVIVIIVLILVLIVVLIGYFRIKKIRYVRYENIKKCNKMIYNVIKIYSKKTRQKIDVRKHTLNECADIMSEWLDSEEEIFRTIIKEYQSCVFGGGTLKNRTIREVEDLVGRLKKKKR